MAEIKDDWIPNAMPRPGKGEHNMTEHAPAISPAPWINNGGQIEAADGTVVATVGTVNEQSPRDTANARRIVAAPEMLQALELANKYLGKALADNLMSDCVMPVGRAFAIVSDVLAQAKEVPAHAQ